MRNYIKNIDHRHYRYFIVYQVHQRTIYNKNATKTQYKQTSTTKL